MCGDEGRSREVPVDPRILEAIGAGAALWRDAPASDEAPELRAEAITMLGLVIQTRLTPRQREIVDLYYYEGKTQPEIAVILGISQQVVSKQLFGAMRKGKKVGGAIRKLRRLLKDRGITFE